MICQMFKLSILLVLYFSRYSFCVIHDTAAAPNSTHTVITEVPVDGPPAPRGAVVTSGRIPIDKAIYYGIDESNALNNNSSMAEPDSSRSAFTVRGILPYFCGFCAAFAVAFTSQVSAVSNHSSNRTNSTSNLSSFFNITRV